MSPWAIEKSRNHYKFWRGDEKLRNTGTATVYEEDVGGFPPDGALLGHARVYLGQFPARYTAQSLPDIETLMMRRFLSDTDHIYLACGATDFRKQIFSLAAIVQVQFKLDPYSGSSASFTAYPFNMYCFKTEFFQRRNFNATLGFNMVSHRNDYVEAVKGNGLFHSVGLSVNR